MPLRFTERILEHLAHSKYEASAAKAIARDMGIDNADRDAFDKAIDTLSSQKRIEVGPDGLVRLPRYGEEVTGKFRLNARGFGFVIPDQPMREGDLFIAPGNTRDAISGDIVRAAVLRQKWRGKGKEVVGRILEVIERGQDHFVGTLVRRGHFSDQQSWLVVSDGRSLHDPVLIRDPHAKNAKQGDKVVIELVHYPEGDYFAEGVIIKVLGEAGEPDVETQAVIVAHGLRTDFDEPVLHEARRAAHEFDKLSQGPWPDREDLTGNFIYTIDPPDAKDFDDAISISRDGETGGWELGVHIADVATFVKPRGQMDEEARARGNSVYLPRLVLPMLPESLSNGVCSLQEGVPRFTKSAFIRFDSDGKVLGQRLAATVIKSAKRLTYLEAQALIDGNQAEARKHARTDTPYPDVLVHALMLSDQLAKILRKRRLRDGMIVLNLPEVELVFDDDGHVIDAVPEDDAFTHTIIEMFMVEANEAVARIFASLNVPVIRRVHPEPVHGDIQELRMYARAAKVDVPERPTRKDLQRLLDLTRNSPAARAVHFAVLRTLAKATYSPAMVGHFALASEHYAHFTSPIRRYPDLSLHRTVEAYLDLTGNGSSSPGGRKRESLARRIMDDDRVLDEGELIVLGKHCSETEVEAEQAERELRDFLVMQFLKEHHLGDEFPGVITGITGGGVYVSIEQYLVEGMIKMQDLPAAQGKSKGADRWVPNERTGRLTAQRSGASIGIGDIVTVQIAKVDLATRHLDLLITELPERTAADSDASRTSQPKGEPHKRKKDKARAEKQRAARRKQKAKHRKK